ncbi:MAG: MotA/TolQ/ExbB proton channel family protein [Bacteroidales bacterium]|jgi:biopolymer transport protein ExbB/TolQ|nr:MotA/TolQ/ExbB proton channel family protein [Bacteroidales bacterium]
MEYVSNLMFWISNGLLVPVIVGLLFFFFKSIFMLGQLFNQYLLRSKQDKALKEGFHGLDKEHVTKFASTLKKSPQTKFTVAAIQLYKEQGSVIHRNRQISQFEIQADKELGKSKVLVKFGPILGLMGTLIPMGPALVGLSTGDIGSMAYNMQVAFATTVLGLFTGAIGFILLQIYQRWTVADLTNLDFISELITQLENEKLCDEGK